MKYAKDSALFLFLICGLLGCENSTFQQPEKKKAGNSPSEETPVPSLAQGYVNGSAWQFVSGRATAFSRSGADYLEIDLWNKSFSNPCDETAGSEFQLRVYIENRTGVSKIDSTDSFSLVPTIIFADRRVQDRFQNNMVADNGVIQISAIDNANINGSVSASFNAIGAEKTSISGNFNVVFCR